MDGFEYVYYREIELSSLHPLSGPREGGTQLAFQVTRPYPQPPFLHTLHHQHHHPAPRSHSVTLPPTTHTPPPNAQLPSR